MHRSESKDSSLTASSSNGMSKIPASNSTLMNGNGQIIYRRSPVSQQANHYQPQSFDTLGSPSTTGYYSEEISETINSLDEDNLNELSQKFEYLQRQIEILTETQSTQDERYKKSRQENDALLNRVHCLEDQLRELEIGSEARAKEDEKRFRDNMARQDKLKSQECEQHLHANFLLQQELFQLRNDLMKSEVLIKTLRAEKDTLESELQDKTSELVGLDEEIHKMKLMIKNLKAEENVKSNLISILNEELEDSQNRSQRDINQSVASKYQSFNQSAKQRSSSSRRSSVTSGLGDEFFSSNAVIANNQVLRDMDGLEMTLDRLRDEDKQLKEMNEELRDENKKLKEMNEELQAQLLNVQLEEGRSLVQEGNKSYSLADEMGDIDVQRLMKALKEQQDDNARLRKYMEDILLKILDKYPDLLDTTTSNSKNLDEKSVHSINS